MGRQLAEEVLDRCPNLPYRQFRVLMALALDATDSTRLAKPGMETITLRSNAGWRTAKRAVAALSDRKLIKVVSSSAPGKRAVYMILPMTGTGDSSLTPVTGDSEVTPEQGTSENNRGQIDAEMGDSEVSPPISTSPSKTTSLSRGERELETMLADLGADMRETFFVIAKFEEDPKIDHPRAYLRKALINGDGPALIAEQREHIAGLDRWREARKRQQEREAEPEPAPVVAPVVALLPEPEPLPAEPDDGDDGEPEPEPLPWTGDELTDPAMAVGDVPF